MGQQTACYDFSGAGVNLWLYADEAYYSYLNTHSDYNNFLYFQCGLDTWGYDLQFLILKLNTVSPYNIINYDLTWTDTDGYGMHTCNGVSVTSGGMVYVVIRHDDGSIWTVSINYNAGTHTVQRFDGNFRDGGYNNVHLCDLVVWSNFCLHFKFCLVLCLSRLI